MAIDLGGRGWWCWVGRKEHSGISPNRLVAALLNCSFEQAAAITGIRGKGAAVSPDDFAGRIAALRNPPTKGIQEPLSWPKEFRPIDDSPLARPFLHYLKKRGFTHKQIMQMADDCGLHYCLHGPFRYRVIFPIEFGGKLVAWTGRTIVEGETQRYLAEGQAPHYLLWFDKLKRGGDCIALVEGPFDAAKLRVLGMPATCFFTSGPSPQQIDLLRDLLPRYKRRILLLDQGTLATAIRVQATLVPIRTEIGTLPSNRKDPAQIGSRKELQSVLTQASA